MSTNGLEIPKCLRNLVFLDLRAYYTGLGMSTGSGYGLRSVRTMFCREISHSTPDVVPGGSVPSTMARISSGRLVKSPSIPASIKPRMVFGSSTVYA